MQLDKNGNRSSIYVQHKGLFPVFTIQNILIRIRVAYGSKGIRKTHPARIKRFHLSETIRMGYYVRACASVRVFVCVCVFVYDWIICKTIHKEIKRLISTYKTFTCRTHTFTCTPKCSRYSMCLFICCFLFRKSYHCSLERSKRLRLLPIVANHRKDRQPKKIEA